MIVSRIAPTPSGYLHLGNILNFILTWVEVRKSNGTLHLRIDDCDSTRYRDEFLEDIFATLDWLNIDFDRGPSGPEDFKKNFSQNLKFNEYQEFLKSITSKFACQCSRSEILSASANGIYPGTCRDKGLNFEPRVTSMRFLSKDALEIGDFIIWRKDNLPAYHLVSVYEDHHMNINYILRGEDLLSSTQAQKQLAQSANLPEFANIKFHHHKLITDQSGKKLSKSDKSVSIHHLRSSGACPADIYAIVAKHMGRTKFNDLSELLN